MNRKSFTQLYWGFLFIMLDFRIQGLDILPDVIGYILFALAFRALASNSEHFDKAFKLDIPMIILSIFSIYEKQEETSVTNSTGINVSFGSLGVVGVLISIASMVLGLVVVYHLFMGIKDMSYNTHQDIYEEADRRWRQYLMLNIALLLSFAVVFIPFVNYVYFIGLLVASIILVFVILGFMRRCGERL